MRDLDEIKNELKKKELREFYKDFLFGPGYGGSIDDDGINNYVILDKRDMCAVLSHKNLMKLEKLLFPKAFEKMVELHKEHKDVKKPN